MNWNEKERQIRLELIASLTRSQQAVARILESIADSAQQSPGLAEVISSNMKSLADLQQTFKAMSQVAAEPDRAPRASKRRPACKRVPAGPWFSNEWDEQRKASRHQSPPRRKRRNSV
ncbi:hypothetical protein [Paenibacillus sp. OV219]|uniref:hypothetical protein n=1 Tax=Paenibacillus sp. OV219 TaxID=1884377 RepID=UPI0008C2DC6C|nr:hypothetical protein [Paenibacillus sp. OV219]SEN75654.1 hypothetical protein SAMN05518847_10461 [Paenibacillus sp. OV219]